MMRWASTVSTEPALENALRDAAATIRGQLGDATPDLVVVFVSHHHGSGFDRVPAVAAGFGAGVLIGCSAGGVIGGGREVEQLPGVSVTAAVLPDVVLQPFHLDADVLPAPDDGAAWQDLLGVRAAAQPHFLLLPDPFSFDPEPLLRGLDAVYPNSRTLGGLASGGRQAGANALFLGGQTHRAGLVGVALSGNIEVDTIVAQGCRPIGQPMFITKCQGNLLWELDGIPAVTVLEDLYQGLSRSDQQLAQRSLFLGIVMNEGRHEYRQGDYLIRNLIGMDATRGALAIGATLHENSVVQFHLRDAQTSAEDLDQLLHGYAASGQAARPHGALLFSCLGRGSNLYGRPGHDTDAFRQHLGQIPLGGFFCNGEIGPVHGTTFLHGYTSAFGLFRSRR
ncbi:MAG TPA: FIST N-terminal domain-containing protein [Candidatus Acidoferrales bacterium]|nr:FIST N-terminal domain-containing protein [Candidatus Acidoferrales bacterium]